MCGIAGIWGNADPARLRAMAAAIAHRGPDDEGFWTQPQAGIGMACRRLAIIDIEGGHQPLANEDGTVVSVFNGEIYNYRELRDELAGRGHVFATQSDTEVLVHLYEEAGTQLADRLRGMFAIAIWDDRKQQLVLIRDRAGKKPLYYMDAAGEFRFASEIKALVAAAREPLDLDDAALVDYLAWSVVPAPRTIYRQIRSALPGHVLVVRDRRIDSVRRYWRLAMAPKSAIDEAEAVEQVDSLIRESVRLRLRSDVPVGVFLSGGIDSGIITAVAAEQSSRPITTICAGFEDGPFDERPLARMVAQRYGTNHHELLIRPDAADVLPKIAAAYDQPFADSSAIPSYYVAQAARRHVKVVLNGDGGDEVFAGYRRYVAAWISGRLHWLDRAEFRPLFRALITALPAPRSFRTSYAFAHRLARGIAREPAQRYLAWAVDGFASDDLTALGASLLCVDDTALVRTVAQDPAVDSGAGPVDRMLACDFESVLPNDLLVKMDIATMAHGVEARCPLLDHALVETVSRYPESLKLGGFVTKPLLRACAARYLPREIRTAPKRGFEIPRLRWLRRDLRQMRDDVILSRDGIVCELFARDRLERFLRDPPAPDPARWAVHVWILLMLGLWDRERTRQQATI